MPNLFFNLFSFLFPLIIFSIFFSVIITIIKGFSSVNRVTRQVSSQVDNIFSQIKTPVTPNTNNETSHSRDKFHKMQKDFSFKKVDSYATGKEIIKDNALSEAEKNVLYGK